DDEALPISRTKSFKPFFQAGDDLRVAMDVGERLVLLGPVHSLVVLVEEHVRYRHNGIRGDGGRNHGGLAFATARSGFPAGSGGDQRKPGHSRRSGGDTRPGAGRAIGLATAPHPGSAGGANAAPDDAAANGMPDAAPSQRKGGILDLSSVF